jgi:hypothetical protein
MQIIACSPDTPRFPPPYQQVDVFAVQEKIIESIMSDVEQQEAVAIVSKPVAEEQTLVSQVLQGYLNNPEYNRQELRELRKFLKQPLVGASVQQLKKALKSFSAINQVSVLIEVVQELYKNQVEFTPNGSSDKKSVNRIKREDLHLICYEYIYS